MRHDRHGERGQTVPFWAFSILMSLTLIFFTYNYSNALRYQVRAQNAADSAATAAIAGDAARLNSVQTLLLALNVQEFKTRDILGAVPNLLTGGDTNCSGTNNILAVSCLNDLASAVNDVQGEVTNLTSVSNALNTFSGQLTGNLDTGTAISNTVSNLYANNCVALSTDCAFKYTTKVALVNGLPVVDEYACEKVATFESSFLPKAPATYYAIGHTTYELAPASQQLTAANNFGGLADSILSSSASLFPNISSSNVVGSYAGLNIGTGFYAPLPVKSTQPSYPASTLC